MLGRGEAGGRNGGISEETSSTVASLGGSAPDATTEDRLAPVAAPALGPGVDDAALAEFDAADLEGILPLDFFPGFPAALRAAAA